MSDSSERLGRWRQRADAHEAAINAVGFAYGRFVRAWEEVIAEAKELNRANKAPTLEYIDRRGTSLAAEMDALRFVLTDTESTGSLAVTQFADALRDTTPVLLSDGSVTLDYACSLLNNHLFNARDRSYRLRTLDTLVTNSMRMNDLFALSRSLLSPQLKRWVSTLDYLKRHLVETIELIGCPPPPPEEERPELGPSI